MQLRSCQRPIHQAREQASNHPFVIQILQDVQDGRRITQRWLWARHHSIVMLRGYQREGIKEPATGGMEKRATWDWDLYSSPNQGYMVWSYQEGAMVGFFQRFTITRCVELFFAQSNTFDDSPMRSTLLGREKCFYKWFQAWEQLAMANSSSTQTIMMCWCSMVLIMGL